MQKWKRGLTAAVAGALALGVVGLAVPRAANAATINGIAGAASYARSHGYTTGIAVVDTQTGRYYGAGSYNRAFASESVAKVFVATEILLQGRMHGSTASIAYKMITQSDDNSMNRLYGGAGGDGVINRVEHHYGINIGYPPHRSGYWGNTHIYPIGLARFYYKIRHDSRVWGWLYNAMRHSTTYGSDGTYQHFGIPSAARGGYAVKQGWGEDDDCFCHAVWNTTGFTDSARYAVVIMTSGPSSTYNSPISRMVTAIAKRVLPGGHIDNPAAHNPHASLSYVHAYGDSVHLAGWAIPTTPGHGCTSASTTAPGASTTAPPTTTVRG